MSISYDTDPALAYAQSNAARFEAELIGLLKIPSISTLPAHAEDVRRVAQWLLDDMRGMGLEAQRFDKDGALPLVVGKWRGAGDGAPTVLIYCHYDVQPAERSDGWQTEPFTPTLQDGKIYARGAVDSKSHVIAQLKAVESMLRSEAGCPVNLVLLFEGEEESGSEHIFQFVAENAALLQADVCVISDGSLPDVNQPELLYGLRGIVCFEVEVTGPQRDLHSGHFGGNVHNPILALSQMLAQLHDAQGRVIVPGFYDTVRPLDPEERAVLAEMLPVAEVEWQAVANAPQPWGDPDYTVYERAVARPTLEINGIAGGWAGEGFKTVLPQHARAKISCRLVPDQDPAQIYDLVRTHLLRLAPPTVQVAVRLSEAGAPALLVERDEPALQAVYAAYERGWGVKPILARAGGSVPVSVVLQRELNAPIVFLPYGYKGGGAHSTNEYVILAMFHKGIATTIHFADQFARQFAQRDKG